jgi:hypothetical protein
MNGTASTSIDCVPSMRQVRDRISREIEAMSYDELVTWLRGHTYTDSLLQRLAQQGAQQATVTDRAIDEQAR